MKVQVILTRTNTGANAKVKSDTAEANKDYPSWDDALKDAEQLGLISGTEVAAAKLLPVGFPFHGNPEIELSSLSAQGFVSGKASPPR
jgi:hypothetical protein